MNTTAIVFLCLFGLAAAGQMTACFFQITTWRRFNKPFVLLTLIGFYLATAKNAIPLIIAALWFSLAGDVLLLFKKLFKIGGLAFFGAHVCYIAAFLQQTDLKALDVGHISAAGAIYLLILIGGRLFIGKRKDFRSRMLAVGYMLGLGAMSLSALLRWWSMGALGAGLVFAGSVLFMISDFSVCVRTFRKDIAPPKIDFIIMATYAPAQLLIALGMTGLW